jgi:hypothetical protein
MDFSLSFSVQVDEETSSNDIIHLWSSILILIINTLYLPEFFCKPMALSKK